MGFLGQKHADILKVQKFPFCVNFLKLAFLGEKRGLIIKFAIFQQSSIHNNELQKISVFYKIGE